ncbi:MAG: DUF6600 domain-containing protein [Acidobacteriota bacterium]
MRVRTHHSLPRRLRSFFVASKMVAAMALALPLWAGAPASLPAADAPREEGGYSVFRVLEGDVVLIPGNDYGALNNQASYGDSSYDGAYDGRDSGGRTGDGPSGIGQPAPAQRYHPILPGDRVFSPAGGRVEIMLSDLNILRLGGNTEVVFDALAGSPEGSDEVTSLRLVEGELQLLVFDDAIGRALPTLSTGNATVYLRDPGSYRLQASGWDYSRLTVRHGFAEVAVSGGAQLARGDEEILVDGAFDVYPRVRQASSRSDLERWGETLEDRARDSYLPAGELDGALAYAAEPLDDHGQWVEVDSRWAWRPRVAVDWRPYWHGRWVYTPAGLHWVSSEPWGYLTSHYGSWQQVHGQGWLWYPGRRWAPAHVHWYWGDGYTAWYPSSRWSRYYGPRYASWGYGFGVHGWGGGSWDLFLDWSWCPTRYLGYRYQGRHHSYGSHIRRHSGWREVPRGIVTTDSRHFTPRHWRDRELQRRLIEDGTVPVAARDRRGVGVEERQLVDLNPYLRRDESLPTEVQRAVVPNRESRQRLSGRAASGDATAGSATTAEQTRRGPVAVSRTGEERFRSTGSSRPPAPAEALRRTTGRSAAADSSRPTDASAQRTRGGAVTRDAGTARGEQPTTTRDRRTGILSSETPTEGRWRGDSRGDSRSESRTRDLRTEAPRQERGRVSGSARPGSSTRSSTEDRRRSSSVEREPTSRSRESARSSSGTSRQRGSSASSGSTSRQRSASPPPRRESSRESTRSSSGSSRQRGSSASSGSTSRQRSASPPPRRESSRESTRSSSGTSRQRGSSASSGSTSRQRSASPPPRRESSRESTRSSSGSSRQRGSSASSGSTSRQRSASPPPKRESRRESTRSSSGSSRASKGNQGSGQRSRGQRMKGQQQRSGGGG